MVCHHRYRRVLDNIYLYSLVPLMQNCHLLWKDQGWTSWLGWQGPPWTLSAKQVCFSFHFSRSNINSCLLFAPVGFGYRFDSLTIAARALRKARHTPPSHRDSPTPPNTPPAQNTDFSEKDSGVDGEEEEENELARAFGIIFSTARQFRVFTILQVWFPVLRRFVCTLLSSISPPVFLNWVLET